jgi:hypothetical protein
MQLHCRAACGIGAFKALNYNENDENINYIIDRLNSMLDCWHDYKLRILGIPLNQTTERFFLVAFYDLNIESLGR